MPKFSRLTEKELKALVHYVSFLQLFGPLDQKKTQKYAELSQKKLNYEQLKEIITSYRPETHTPRRGAPAPLY